MKRIISVMLVCLLAFSYFAVIARAESAMMPEGIGLAPLRAGGGGSSGGGGGGGGGSSSGGTHSSGSRRPLTLPELIMQYVAIFILSFSSSIVFYIQLTKRSRRSKKLMKKMMESDSAWKFKDISKTVSDGFYAIQKAWTEMDMSPAAKYMSDELYESFQTQLNWMGYKKQKNVLEKISLLDALPVAVHDDADNSRDFVWFYIKGRMVDYTVDTDSQMKISGKTTPSSFVEYWQFVRREDNWVLNKILQKNESGQIPFNE